MQVSIPILAGHCEVAQKNAEQIGFSEEIRENLGQLSRSEIRRPRASPAARHRERLCPRAQ